MKLNIEKWLETINPSVNVTDLFGESIVCYKAGAYRASLLYSYLAFLTILKERLISSNKPTHTPVGMWDDLIHNIQKENRWEESVYESTQNATQPIFQTPEHIRLQIKYWKDRRNDSAHYKQNEINEHHVEAFWSFVKSNLSKITVEGGKESLINKFTVHFDHTKTKPGSDFSHLIQEIPSAMEPQEMTLFLDSLNDVINDFMLYQDEFNLVCEKCLRELPSAYIEKVVNYLLNKNDRYVKLLLYKPTLIQFFKLTPQEIRELWSKKVSHSTTCLDLLAVLLRIDLIPQNEIDEAISRFAGIGSYPPDELELDNTLWKYGFYEKIYERYFKNSKLNLGSWTSVNAKAHLIMSCIERKGFDDLIVEKICNAFNQNYHSFNLAGLLEKHFIDHPAAKTDFLTKAQKGGWPIPKHIKNLAGNP